MEQISVLLMALMALAGLAYSAAKTKEKELYINILNKNKVPDYDKHVHNMNEQFNINKKLIEIQDLENIDAIGSKENGGDPENCYYERTVVQPYALKTMNTTDFVVQLNYFRQIINVTRCFGEKKSCFRNIFPEDSTQCGEKYGAISLYVYDPETNKLRYQMYEVPVGCTCRFRNWD